MQSIRRAEQKDANRVWALSNDPSVREASFNSDPIAWAAHAQWFARAIEDPQMLFLLSFADEKDDYFIGQVRFRGISEHDYEISISVTPTYRGKGFGNEMLSLALGTLARFDSSAIAHAWVKLGNDSSIRLFKTLRFEEAVEESADGGEKLHFSIRAAIWDEGL
jgi:L-amino acid N-acyltransferase YncA